jgi:hypothetical protein
VALSTVIGGDRRSESAHVRVVTSGHGEKDLGRLTSGPVSKLAQPNIFQLIKFSSNLEIQFESLPEFQKYPNFA